MLISCTKKLQDQLKIKPCMVEISDPLFSWHANMISINRRKTLVLVNDDNRYVIILHRIKSKGFENIDSVVISGIKETLLADCVKPEVVDRYLNDGGNVIYSKTRNRALVARMNKGCEAAKIFVDSYCPQTVIQPGVSKKANTYVFVDAGEKHYHPYELFYNALEIRYGKPIFSTKALVLKITLKLEHFDVWRRVVVPINLNFEDLHKVIRDCFGWGYSHLHDFVVYSDQNPIVSIVSNEDEINEYSRKEPTFLENQTAIAEYLPKYEHIVYTYDYGDNWEHTIEVESVLSDFDKNYPVCLEGQGDRPPEDVGGESGYMEFLEIINNPQHEDYKQMKSWFESQYYKGFKIESVNRQLKYLY